MTKPTKGGRRPGSGRPARYRGKTDQSTFMLTPAGRAKVRHVALVFQCSESDAAECLIRAAAVHVLTMPKKYSHGS